VAVSRRGRGRLLVGGSECVYADRDLVSARIDDGPDENNVICAFINFSCSDDLRYLDEELFPLAISDKKFGIIAPTTELSPR
jgi:hypothetical protein